jgi:hypothetical protein
MAIKSKSQLSIDIAASTFTSPQQTILDDIVDSYEDIFPQLTTVQRDALTPTNGQVVYNTDNARYEYWNGSAWFGIGQNISTPLVVKIDLSSADLLALDSTPIAVASAIGAGYALVPAGISYRYTYGTAAYTGSYNIQLKSSTATGSNIFLAITSVALNSGASRSGGLPTNTGTGINAIVENDDLVLSASDAISTGDGVLTVWVTYSIIDY